ncbi:MAG: hypothetical protein ACYTG1_10190 [Planctomycetota bacterium]
MARTNRPCPLLLASAALAVTGLLAGCQTNGTEVALDENGVPRYEHPHQDWWNYKFVYYPQDQIYYEPHTRMYYWFEDGAWLEGQRLPARFAPKHENARFVYLDSTRPWMHHAQTTRVYGPSNDAIPGSLDPTNMIEEETAITTAESEYADGEF